MMQYKEKVPDTVDYLIAVGVAGSAYFASLKLVELAEESVDSSAEWFLLRIGVVLGASISGAAGGYISNRIRGYFFENNDGH